MPSKSGRLYGTVALTERLGAETIVAWTLIDRGRIITALVRDAVYPRVRRSPSPSSWRRRISSRPEALSVGIFQAHGTLGSQAGRQAGRTLRQATDLL